MGNLSNYFGQNIDRRRIVITGGTTGIGKATAALLASLGGHILFLEEIKTISIRPLMILKRRQKVKCTELLPILPEKKILN